MAARKFAFAAFAASAITLAPAASSVRRHADSGLQLPLRWHPIEARAEECELVVAGFCDAMGVIAARLDARGQSSIETDGDVGRAHRALLRAERLAFPGGPIGLRRSILFALANASLYLGRLDDVE